MNVVGIDFSSHSIDLVKLGEQGRDADWWHIASDPKRTPFERARQLAHDMPGPASHYWDDVYLVGLEDPHSAQNRTAKVLGYAAGVVAASVAGRVTVIQTAPAEWKRLTVGHARAGKDDVARWARNAWRNAPSGVTQDALDAFAIAWAVRDLNQSAIDAA